MKATIKQQQSVTIFHLDGRLDSNSAPQLEKQMQDFITKPASHLVFDFQNLDYISSAGLRVVLNTAKAFQSGPFRFLACGLQDHVREVFEISGFDSFIAICPTIEDSMTTLADEPGE